MRALGVLAHQLPSPLLLPLATQQQVRLRGDTSSNLSTCLRGGQANDSQQACKTLTGRLCSVAARLCALQLCDFPGGQSRAHAEGGGGGE